MVISLQQTVSELTTRVGGIDIQVEALADATETINGDVDGLDNTVEGHSNQLSEIENQIEVLEEDVGRLEESFDDIKNNTDGPSDGNDNSVQFLFKCLFCIDWNIVENFYKDLENRVSALEEKVDSIELQLKSTMRYPASCQELFDNGKRSNGQE